MDVSSSASVYGWEVVGQPRLLDRDWNNPCKFAKEISWAVCGCENRIDDNRQTVMCLEMCTSWFQQWRQKKTEKLCTFYLNVLPILCLQQTLVISFNAKGQVRTRNNVSPVSPDGYFVSFLYRHTTKISFLCQLTVYSKVKKQLAPSWFLDMVFHMFVTLTCFSSAN